MLNLPSGSNYGKLVKTCFEPEKNWLFVGSDFDALEDKVNALLTKIQINWLYMNKDSVGTV